MAKKGMTLRYKPRKRQRNKYNPTMSTDDSIKSFGKTCLYVFLFLGLMALMVFGMKKMGTFDRGYTAPEKEETAFDYVNISIGTVFNRSDKAYYVLFDDYGTNLSSDVYISTLLEDVDIPVYKVDMSKEVNAKYKGEEANKKATNSNELSINDITLIRIVNGKIANYIIGSEAIEEYLSK